MVTTIDLTQDNVALPRLHKVYISGKPQATPRPRLFRTGVVNKKSRETTAFGQKAKGLLMSASSNNNNNNNNNNFPIFGPDVPVAVTVWFFLPRPTTDFKCNKRTTGRLKAAAKELLFPTITPDIDNLCKFVLDALNGVGFHDDRQVVKLVAFKCRDTEDDGPCLGGTYIEFHKFEPSLHGPLPVVNRL